MKVELFQDLCFSKNMEISNTDVGKGAIRIIYRFTDMYHQEYWTTAIEN